MQLYLLSPVQVPLAAPPHASGVRVLHFDPVDLTQSKHYETSAWIGSRLGLLL